MTTTTTTPAMPAHRNRTGFPLQACNRCGGSGNYSYNSMHGSTCYGCGGTGWVVAAGARKAYGEYHEAARRRRLPTTTALQPGDVVTCEFAGMMSDKAHPDAVWREVADIDPTGEWCGSSAVGVEGTPGYCKVDQYYQIVTFTDGTTKKVNAAQCWIRKGALDPAPYLEAALKGWRKAGCKGGRK